jgi:uncharacterized cupin superfamily protein
MPRLDLETIPQTNRTGYPDEHASEVGERWYRRLAPPGGLIEFGASHVVLKPGAWSSQRHWHAGEDELLVMVSGEAVLVEDDGRTVLHPGDICAWPKAAENGHHLRNESDADCCFVAISGGVNSGGFYPDIDMMWDARDRYLHKDGREYPVKRA